MKVRNLLLRCTFVAALTVILPHQVRAELFDLDGKVIPGSEDVNLALPGNSLSEIDFSQVSLINTTIIASELTAEQVYATASYRSGDMRGVNFFGTGLLIYTRYELQGWNFRDQNLAGSRFELADAANIDFSGANLTDATIGYALFQNATMTDAQFHNASFFKTDLTGATFENSNLVGADLRDTTLNGTNFTDANLQNASLRFATGTIECDPILLIAFGIENCGVDVEASFADNFDATTTYNQWTQFPFGFNPDSFGMTFVESPVGDFNGDKTVDAVDIDQLALRLRRGDDRDPLRFEPFGDGIAVIELGNDFTVFATPEAMVDKNALLEAYDVLAISPIWDSSPEGIERWAAERRRLTAKNSEWLEPMFDLTGDGSVNKNDMNDLIGTVLRTGPGDANLDGRFDSRDLIQVFQFGEYEDGPRDNSTWASGDWNGNGDFNSLDLVLAFQSDTYEASSAASATVPEPTGGASMLLALLWLSHARRIRRSSKC